MEVDALDPLRTVWTIHRPV
jgi:hypothetical protein